MSSTTFDPDATMNLADDDDAMTLDLSEVDENAAGPPPLPPGTYDAVVDGVELGVSKSKGNKMLTWIFRVTTEEGQERTIYTWTVFTEQGLPRLKQALMAVDPGIDLAHFRPAHDTGRLIGLPCRVQLKTRNFEGQVRNNVARVLPPSQAEATESFLQ